MAGGGRQSAPVRPSAGRGPDRPADRPPDAGPSRAVPRQGVRCGSPRPAARARGVRPGSFQRVQPAPRHRRGERRPQGVRDAPAPEHTAHEPVGALGSGGVRLGAVRVQPGRRAGLRGPGARDAARRLGNDAGAHGQRGAGVLPTQHERAGRADRSGAGGAGHRESGRPRPDPGVRRDDPAGAGVRPRAPRGGRPLGARAADGAPRTDRDRAERVRLHVERRTSQPAGPPPRGRGLPRD